MPSRRYPGVYIEEVAGGARPIAAVGTSTACFFGVAPGVDAPLRSPVCVNSFSEVLSIFATDAPQGTQLINALMGFFAMGGTHACVVHLGADATALTAADLVLSDDHDDISLIAAPGFTDRASVEAVLDHVEARRDRFAVLDMAEGGTRDMMATPQPEGGLRPRGSGSGRAAIYAPWCLARDAITGAETAVPPSGHVCGAYAQTDATRGVWKSPAGVALHGTHALTRSFSDADQGVLNPAGVNLLRAFPDGLVIWGARTLGTSPEWRHVAVRRLATMVEQSILRGTAWTVFEPNDKTLWRSLRRDVGAFLNGLWRDGALMGATAEEAFFVACDADTNPDPANAPVSLVVGIAAVKPAEFIVLSLRAGHDAAGPDHDASDASIARVAPEDLPEP